ncbi:MAG TPA: hypothetical protein VHD89_07305 [Rhodanobacteraceae bacterium]|jgi:hypothetical protein|nr:hypothetical protein [Rhodanobacteraceae bacterium]
MAVVLGSGTAMMRRSAPQRKVKRAFVESQATELFAMDGGFNGVVALPDPSACSLRKS